MELGIYTFWDTASDPVTGSSLSTAQRISDLMAEIVLADEVGLDVFAVGKHYRHEYVRSSPGRSIELFGTQAAPIVRKHI